MGIEMTKKVWFEDEEKKMRHKQKIYEVLINLSEKHGV